jgi:hypothetical protein
MSRENLSKYPTRRPFERTVKMLQVRVLFC